MAHDGYWHGNMIYQIAEHNENINVDVNDKSYISYGSYIRDVKYAVGIVVRVNEEIFN